MSKRTNWSKRKESFYDQCSLWNTKLLLLDWFRFKWAFSHSYRKIDLVLILLWRFVGVVVDRWLFFKGGHLHKFVYTGGPRYSRTFYLRIRLFTFKKIGPKWQFSSQKWTFYLRIQDSRSKGRNVSTANNKGNLY